MLANEIFTALSVLQMISSVNLANILVFGESEVFNVDRLHWSGGIMFLMAQVTGVGTHAV